MGPVDDIVDLDQCQTMTTLDEVFAPIEGDTVPYIDPDDACFDDEAYWNAFAEFMEEKRRKVRRERRRYLLQVLKDEKDEDSQESCHSDTGVDSDTSEFAMKECISSAYPPPVRPKRTRRQPTATVSSASLDEKEAHLSRERIMLFKEIKKLCRAAGSPIFTLAELRNSSQKAEQILKVNRRYQHVRSLMNQGYITQKPEDHGRGKYTLTKKTYKVLHGR